LALLTTRGAVIFVMMWLAGLFLLPYVSYGDALFSPLVALLDIALVLAVFNGDLCINSAPAPAGWRSFAESAFIDESVRLDEDSSHVTAPLDRRVERSVQPFVSMEGSQCSEGS
jgi:hypothetical protein